MPKIWSKNKPLKVGGHLGRSFGNMYLLLSHYIFQLAQQCVCQPILNIATIQKHRSIIQKCLSSRVDQSVETYRRCPYNPDTSLGTIYKMSLPVQMCRSKKKQTEHYLDITTHQPHPYSYNCNFFLFPYNSITLLKSQTKKYFTSMTCNIKPFSIKSVL